MLVLRRIHVRYALRAPDASPDTIDRVHAMHARFCPVYRSISKAVEITTEYGMVER